MVVSVTLLFYFFNRLNNFYRLFMCLALGNNSAVRRCNLVCPAPLNSPRQRIVKHLMEKKIANHFLWGHFLPYLFKTTAKRISKFLYNYKYATIIMRLEFICDSQ